MIVLLGCKLMLVTEGQAMRMPTPSSSGESSDSNSLVGPSLQATHICEKCLSNASSLHWAAYYGHTDCVRLLIDTKTDVNLQTKSGHTALHSVASQAKSSQADHLLKYKKCIELLLNAGALLDLGPITNTDNQSLITQRAQQQALVNECYEELIEYIRNKQNNVLEQMKTVPVLEDFPPGLLPLIASFASFSIDSETPTAPETPSSPETPKTPSSPSIAASGPANT